MVFFEVVSDVKKDFTFTFVICYYLSLFLFKKVLIVLKTLRLYRNPTIYFVSNDYTFRTSVKFPLLTARTRHT